MRSKRPPVVAVRRVPPAASTPAPVSVLLMAGFMFCGISGGCAFAPAAPPDPQLRELAERYVRSALRFPQSPAIRAEAIEAAESLGPQTHLLIRDGLKDEHPGVRFAACLALGRLREAGALPAIRERLADTDGSVQVGACFALERLGDASQRPRWAEALRRHKDATVRRNAALAMGQLGDEAVVPLLVSAATNDEDDGVRLQAMEALAIMGQKRAVNRFIHDAYGGAGYKQPFALLALGHVKDTSVLPVLRARLADAPYLEARLAAARSLAMHGYADGYDLAARSLTWNQPQTGLPDDSPENQVMRVRSMAALALGEIGDHRALGMLKQRMQTPDDPRVQLATARAILMILK